MAVKIKELSLMAALLMCASVQSTEVTLQQLSYLKQLSLSDYSQQTLTAFSEQSAEAIWYQYLRLNDAVIETAPSKTQVNWVNSLLKSDQIITIANPDHPNQQLTVVNISQQAKATLKQWEILAQAQEINGLWFQGNLNWQTLQDRDHRAVHNWLNSISLEQLMQVAQSIEKDEKLSTDNAIVSILAMRSKSPDLLSQLWRLTADQYSYQALQKIPDLLDEERAVAQLGIASENPALFSQALMLMVQRFPQHHLTQAAVADGLADPDHMWVATALIKRISDPSFLLKLNDGLAARNPVVNQLIKQRLQEVQ